MRSLVLGLAFSSLSLSGVRAGFPSKIYGVNLGSWLVLEPWMLPEEWVKMGGQICDNCSTCISSEFAFSQAYPATVDKQFNQHWNTWFTQDDVNKLVDLGLNTVRIPLGYWIIEDLVDRRTEFYPRGGLAQLRRGLKQLRKAGIVVILGHHALPGVQTPLQEFTGRCTTDVQFYTPYNYDRALVWTAVMTILSHVDSAFSNVVSIEAANQPLRDPNQTPGYGDFQKNFVHVVRAVECLLGLKAKAEVNANVLASLELATPTMTVKVRSVILEAIPILSKMGVNLPRKVDFDLSVHGKKTKPAIDYHRKKIKPLILSFMNVLWQNDNPPNPADAALGPQIYESHLYYAFGGVAAANEDAYLTNNCNLNQVKANAALGNSPLYFGEWALSTQFPASDKFLRKWADAQKRTYSKGAGWLFWNFKIEISDKVDDLARQWSYFEGVRRGYFTKDPSKLFDPHVCDPYINSTASG